jgi:thioester reductase-like protein
VFLTGATGFLGAHLLLELLRLTRDSVVALVRKKDEVAQSGGLVETVARAVTAVTGATRGDLERLGFERRVEVMHGDLAHPLFGLDAATFDALARRVDLILHCGAMVNWVKGYSAMRAANVLGTVECIKLAAAARIKPLVFVSTISTAGRSESELLPAQIVLSGSPYGLSKWVAETLVERARAAGLPAVVIRPGMISGDTRTGYSAPEQFLSRLFTGIVQLGAYPNEEAPLDMTPVDYVAKVTVALSSLPGALGGTFHVVNNTRVGTYAQVGRVACALGYKLDCLPYDQWRQRLLADLAATPNAAQTRALYALLPFFGERFNLAIGPFANAQSSELLRTIGVQCPPADDSLVALYFRGLAVRCAIPPPPAK